MLVLSRALVSVTEFQQANHVVVPACCAVDRCRQAGIPVAKHPLRGIGLLLACGPCCCLSALVMSPCMHTSNWFLVQSKCDVRLHCVLVVPHALCVPRFKNA